MTAELALRSGSATSESPSPYNGFRKFTNSTVESLCKLFKIEFDGAIYELIEKQADFDADAKCPVEGPYSPDTYRDETRPRAYSPAGNTEPLYLRKLEEIDSTWIESYLSNQLYGMVDNNSYSMRSYAKEHQTARMLVDDDGDAYTEAELAVEYSGDYSPEEISRAKEKIPYLLRRLHDKSKQLKVHVISLIIAYEKAKKSVNVANRSASRKRRVQPRDLLDYGVHSMNPNGTIGPMFPADANNSKPAFKEAKEWILSSYEAQDTYYDDMVNLLHYYDVMGIDIKEEDPATYQEEYISALTVLYITSNRDYVMRKRNGFHKEVFEALKRVPLENLESIGMMQEIDEYAIYETTMNIFNNSVFIEDSIKHRRDYLSEDECSRIDGSMFLFMGYVNVLQSKNYNITKMKTYDGFYFISSEEPLIIDVRCIISENESDTQMFGMEDKAMLHESGFLVRVAAGHYTKFLDTTLACDYIKDFREGRAGLVKYDKQSFGTWQELSI